MGNVMKNPKVRNLRLLLYSSNKLIDKSDPYCFSRRPSKSKVPLQDPSRDADEGHSDNIHL